SARRAGPVRGRTGRHAGKPARRTWTAGPPAGRAGRGCAMRATWPAPATIARISQPPNFPADRNIHPTGDTTMNDTIITTAPVPGVTRNAGYTVRAVMPNGRDGWYVAAEDADRGTWVTWACAAVDGELAYAWGHYFHSGNQGENRTGALR